MTAEAKELYNFIMSRETAEEVLVKIKSSENMKYEVVELVNVGSISYCRDYCNTDYFFTRDDRNQVTTRIIREITNFDEKEFEECKQLLMKNKISESDIFESYEIAPRKSNSYLEICGLFVQAWKFVNKHTGHPFETFDELWDNVSGEREIGRFDCMENYYFYSPKYYIGAFILSGALAWAEVWSKEKDKVIAYVRMETI